MSKCRICDCVGQTVKDLGEISLVDEFPAEQFCCFCFAFLRNMNLFPHRDFETNEFVELLLDLERISLQFQGVVVIVV